MIQRTGRESNAMEDQAVMTPGFRFYPTEEELVSFYLHNKLEERRQGLDRVIPVLYIYDFNPWDLPQYAGEMCQGDPEQWFFFIPRQEKEARGGRPNRLTTSGYWKATGSPGWVFSSQNRIIGVKKTMVFYRGRAPAGRKTDWKMNEYAAIIDEGDHQAVASSSTITYSAFPKLRQEFSLCRVYKKSKCLRAFDRRPSAAAVLVFGGQTRNANHEATASDDQNRPTTFMEKTTSLESSFSGDHPDPPSQLSTAQPAGSHDWDMAVDNGPLWEWEQLNNCL